MGKIPVFDVIQSYDLSILTSLMACQSPIANWLAWLVATLAWKGWLWGVIIISSWVRKQRTFAAEVSIAMVVAIIGGLPLKGLIARPRPDLFASQQLNIPMPELLSTQHSFPSGHTLLAAAFAFVVLSRWKDWRAVAAMLFVVVVAVARVYQGMHWPTDCLGSVVLGAIAAAVAIQVCKLPVIRRFTEPAMAGVSLGETNTASAAVETSTTSAIVETKAASTSSETKDRTPIGTR